MNVLIAIGVGFISGLIVFLLSRMWIAYRKRHHQRIVLSDSFVPESLTIGVTVTTLLFIYLVH